ncbi:uncharacterized protein LOC123230033 [Mangifera indica]|uniref:uncharacterized protein LOC123230033 n=1 Tax=Mangifera indica TaxID=29780 RepID=UPI001CFB9FD4|nr:uncharacterized protein LOC123230033 [Mangifera indica]
MGNGYNHHFHHRNLHIHKSTFLPMLCSRPSIKDAVLPKWEDRSTSVSGDPLSPKISCMGQVKRTNKIVGFPTSHKLTISTKTNNNNNVKYFKLKKLFSGNNLTANTNITTTTCCRRKEMSLNGVSNKPKVEDVKESDVCINIIEMDPPLPVIKKVAKPDDKGDENSLWKRRSGGGALKSLQLQHLQIPRHQLEVSTV